MRFRALHLTRFGSFTDQSIQFGPLAKTPDFHIIYGDNEAGKSTLRDAVTAFLFGIPARTEYNFLHDYKALEIGADLDLSGGPLSGVRIKANRESFRTTDGAVLSDDLLNRELLGLSESDFINLFSLDLNALLDGGADILQAKGDLGALLFAGASGISSVTQKVDQARNTANAFFKPRASSSLLSQKLKQLKDIDADLKSLDIHAPHFRQLKAATKSAQIVYDEAATALKESRTAYQKQDHMLQAIDPWREYLDFQTQLKAYGEVPAADKDTLERANTLLNQRRTLEDAKAELEMRLKSAETEIKGLQQPVYQQKLVSGLNTIEIDNLEARASTARLDLPSRREELDSLKRQISGALGRLGEDPNSDPEPILISKISAAQISALANQGEHHAADKARANSELDTAKSDLALAEEVFSDLAKPRDFSTLEDTLTSYRRDLDIEQLRIMEADQESAQRRLESTFAELLPWRGTAEELDSVITPSASVLESIQRKMDSTITELNRLESEKKSLRRTIESEAAKITELEADPDVISDQAATDLLNKRDKRWKDHVDSIEKGRLENIKATAEAFETTMNDHDLASSKRLARASDLGEIKSHRGNKKGADAEIALVDNSLAETQATLKAFNDEVAGFTKVLGIPASTSISDINSWLAARRRALGEWIEHRSRDKQIETRKSRFSQATKVLIDALKGVGVNHTGDAETVLAAGERTLTSLRREAEAHKVAKAKYDTLESQHRQRNDEAEAAKSAYDSWQTEWNTELKKHSLVKDSTSVIKARLEVLNDLAIKFEEFQKLSRRISLMETNIASFSDAVVHLANEAGISDKNDEYSKRFNALKIEAKELAKREAQRESTQSLIDTENVALQANADKLSTLKSEVDALCIRFAVEDLDACIKALRSAEEVQALSDQTATLRRQLSGLLASDDETDWSKALSPLISDQDSLSSAKAAHENAELEIEMEDERVRGLYSDWKDAERAQMEIGDDESVARLQQKRTTLLEDIKHGAQKFIGLKASAIVVDEAVRLFRDQHRGDMLQKASEAFSSMTLGRYPRLVTVTANDREVLVAERHDKATLSAEKLSTGARAQLYLSLRIAGHAEYTNTHTPLPFLADDILEEFDDKRAKNTILLMMKMAEVGQVIYLTHHQHLVDMALAVAPDRCTIHRLNSSTPDSSTLTI